MTSYATHDTVRIAYELAGRRNGARRSPRPLLMIHGLGYERHGFGPGLPLIGAERPLLLLDNRGIGESDVPPGPYAMRDLAADVVAVLDAAGLDSVDVLGISLGGMIAQELAVTAPERVSRLVLACTTPGRAGYAMPLRTVVLFNKVARLSFEESLRRLVQNSLSDLTVRERPELIEEVVAYRLQHGPDVKGWQAQAAAGASFDALGRLSEIAMPTLVLHGTDDHVVDKRNGSLLAEAIPDARLQLFPGTGHLFFWEQPERFSAAVLAFLAEEA